jgi:hypothetical protein
MMNQFERGKKGVSVRIFSNRNDTFGGHILPNPAGLVIILAVFLMIVRGVLVAA